MKPIHDAWLIQIEVTNACTRRCAHCSRAVPHIRKPYFADLTFVEKALQSLDGWKHGVGCMGGEPTLHPDFLDICRLYAKYFPREQCGLWTGGGKWFDRYEQVIHSVFGTLLYNDHSEIGKHQPFLLSAEEIVPDEQLRDRLIDECWLQEKWSPAITPKGGFFCEIAATLDLLFDGPGGYPLEVDWWRKTPEQFADQRQRYCRHCSIAIPMQPISNNLKYDLVSPGNAKRLLKAGSPLAEKGGIKIVSPLHNQDELKAILNAANEIDPWNYLGPKKIRKKKG